MLTKKQHDLLQFIDKHLKTRGVSPSFDEMKDALGLKSKSGIHRLITGLEERGFIRRLPHRARALEVLQLPQNLKQPENINSGFKPNVIEGGFQKETLESSSEELTQIPLYGRIAAGLPIEAVRDDTATMAIPASMVGRGDHYALEVQGDSMIDAGIHDGDIAVIERRDNADNGTIIVALVDDNEVTLKRLRRKGQSVALEPANELHETRIFGPDRVRIQGRLKAILRQY
ncbi:MAG: repressor LexA [Rhodospirillaceae bacterium]|nr:repressor LexA [Rhodospirillaceae bacterium]|tara:strand:- start:1702 stop:2391 length:690 start_codon:yes stop_codon:yes gene_type:complete